MVSLQHVGIKWAKSPESCSFGLGILRTVHFSCRCVRPHMCVPEYAGIILKFAVTTEMPAFATVSWLIFLREKNSWLFPLLSPVCGIIGHGSWHITALFPLKVFLQPLSQSSTVDVTSFGKQIVSLAIYIICLRSILFIFICNPILKFQNRKQYTKTTGTVLFTVTKTHWPQTVIYSMYCMLQYVRVRNFQFLCLKRVTAHQRIEPWTYEKFL